jgi:flagellar hook protein FlgE
MDVIAHNIANVNTHGFKASRMTFADAFSQTIRGAAGPSPDVGRGGTNPMQIGLGVNVSSIQRNMSPGAAQRTDDSLHLMIEGDGFFVVGDDVSGFLFTRAGDFQRDAHWNIHAPNGMRLQGWPAPWDQGNPFWADGSVRMPSRGPLQGIQIDSFMRNVPPRATGNVEMVGNLRFTDAIGENRLTGIPSSITFQDSLGTSYSMDIRFRWSAFDPVTHEPLPGNWVLEIADHMIRTEDNTRIDVTLTPAAGPDGFGFLSDLEFNENGRPIIPAAPPNPFTPFINFVVPGLPPGVYFGQPHPGVGVPPGVQPLLRLDFTGLTQNAGNTTVRLFHQDGLEPGTLIGLSTGGDGMITGTYSNGEAFPLWQIALAMFDNPAGLAALGGNMFAMTTNSGGFDGMGITPGAAGTQLLGGTLEMSNVDLAAEFTEMITTQRGFQANSRIISTSDEMLQELVNLRR